MSKYYPDRVIEPGRFFDFDDTYENQIYQEADRALEAYLNALSFDDIKDLQTIMYLGRGDGCEEGSGEYQFQDLRAEFDRRWNTKEIEINQMSEKSPLGEYLIKGKEILGF